MFLTVVKNIRKISSLLDFRYIDVKRTFSLDVAMSIKHILKEVIVIFDFFFTKL